MKSKPIFLTVATALLLASSACRPDGTSDDKHYTMTVTNKTFVGDFSNSGSSGWQIVTPSQSDSNTVVRVYELPVGTNSRKLVVETSVAGGAFKEIFSCTNEWQTSPAESFKPTFRP